MHIGLTPHCGVCGTAAAVGEKCTALLGESRAAEYSYLHHVDAFPFPDVGSSIQRVGGMRLCREPGCPRCAAALEACTVHADCLALFRRYCLRPDRDALERLWVAAAWRRPWRGVPCLWLDGADELVSAECLPSSDGEQNGGLGLLGRGLKRLPLEVVQMIRRHSAASPLWRYGAVHDLARRLSSCDVSDELLSMPLCSVVGWERGSLPAATATSAPRRSLPIIRLTVDACGLRAVEWLPSWPAPGTSRSDSRAFVVMDESQIQNITVHFKFGHARLELPVTMHGLQVWDTPTPPTAPACRFEPAVITPSSRFHTIPLDEVDGMTLFFCGGRVHAIHAHTPSAPYASATLARLTDGQQRAMTWLYVPFATNDRVVAFGTRRRAASVSGRFCFIFRTQLVGDVVVGPSVPRTVEDACLGYAPPITLVYGAADPQPVSVVGAYTTGPRVDWKPTAPLPPPNLHPLLRNAYVSRAPLDHVVLVRVFSDEEHGFCRGIILVYKNGGMRALGQCRIGSDPVSDYENPITLCTRTTSTMQPHNSAICTVYVQAVTTGLHEHSETGWTCSSFRGNLAFWFTNEESRLTRSGLQIWSPV